MVIAFGCLGGMFGVLGLAVLSAVPEANVRHTESFVGFGHTH
jgi:hypothetical protein